MRAVPWRRILRDQNLRQLSTVYFCYFFVIWLYLAWFPTYLREARHFAGLNAGLASLPPLVATATNIPAGLLSAPFASRRGHFPRGRRSPSPPPSLPTLPHPHPPAVAPP